ncbi:hypothetical protein C8R43DRAFT_1122463 [Mycena crocata]|nr:hypothetical protein C8R43DRAFT_1122463 [Mycena crocata]
MATHAEKDWLVLRTEGAVPVDQTFAQFLSRKPAAVLPPRNLTYSTMNPAQRDRARRLLGRSSVSEPAPSATRIRTAAERARRARIRNGFREPQLRPLTRKNLYVGGILPPPLSTERLHQKCSLCSNVKCHPVSYLCGHSHCYVCVRIWLETSWDCPSCETLMRRAPHRHTGEEDGLKADYPDWGNTSQVLYSFDGLTFPNPPRYLDWSD